MSETAPQLSGAPEIFSALGLELDDATAQSFEKLEIQEQLADEAREVWAAADEAKRENPWPGKTDDILVPPEVNDESPDWEKIVLKRANKMNEATDRASKTKIDLAHTLDQDPAIPQFSKAAIIQAMFQASPKDRLSYAIRFEQALCELDEALREDEVIYVPDGTAKKTDFHSVFEPGINVEIDWTLKRHPAAIVSANGLFTQRKDGDEVYQLELYGRQEGSLSKAQPIEALAVNAFAKGDTDTGNPKFIVGEAALDVLSEKYTTSPADALILALYASYEGLRPDITKRFSDEDLADIRQQITATMARQVMVAVVVDPTEAISIIAESDQSRAVIGFDHADPHRLRPLLKMLQYFERDKLEHAITAEIDALESAILQGKELASRLPEVTVGKARLAGYLDTLFEE